MDSTDVQFHAVSIATIASEYEYEKKQAVGGRAASTICPRPSPSPVGAKTHCAAEQTAT